MMSGHFNDSRVEWIRFLSPINNGLPTWIRRKEPRSETYTVRSATPCSTRRSEACTRVTLQCLQSLSPDWSADIRSQVGSAYEAREKTPRIYSASSSVVIGDHHFYLLAMCE